MVFSRVSVPHRDGNVGEFFATRPETPIEQNLALKALRQSVPIGQEPPKVFVSADGWFAEAVPKTPDNPLNSGEHLICRVDPNASFEDVRNLSRAQIAETFGQWALTHF